MNTFGNRLKELRTETNLTGGEFGKIFNVSKSAISNWEVRGRFPDEDMLKKLAAYFDVSLDYLMGKSDIRNPIAIDEDVKGFTTKLVEQLIKENIIKDVDHIPDDIVNMVISALKYDLKQKKER